MSVLLVSSVLAQNNEQKVDFRGHAYHLKDGGSPFDSIRQSLHMIDRWHQSNNDDKNLLLSKSKSIYPDKFTAERVLGDSSMVHRYIVNDSGEFNVFEKKMLNNGAHFYYRNGVPENEMRFYKYLTRYYVE